MTLDEKARRGQDRMGQPMERIDRIDDDGGRQDQDRRRPGGDLGGPGGMTGVKDWRKAKKREEAEGRYTW